jgi:uncharacterized protein
MVDTHAQSLNLNLVWMDSSLSNADTRVYREHHDVKWTFTDCSSFAITRQLGMTQSFAFDENSNQAGFTKLL